MNKSSLSTFVESLVLAAVLTIFSVTVAEAAGWITELNWWEIAATATSFSCTYMCVKQTRWNYPMAVLSTGLLSYVFWTSGLYASMALNLYLIPTVIYGYFIWGRDDDTKPVKHVKYLDVIIGYIPFTIIAYGGALGVVTYFGGNFSPLDSWLLVGSILAQFLLDRKKIETWFIWIAVNIVSIYVYFESGLYLLAIQFAFFLLNAVYGYLSWRKTLNVDQTT